MTTLFYHYHMCKLIGVGPFGTFLEGVITGERFCVPSGPTNRCVGRKPIWDDNNDPCDVCGWQSNVIKWEDRDGLV